MINRAALIVKYREPFVAWLNEVCPLDDGSVISLSITNEDSQVYLIDDDDAEELDEWLDLNFDMLFENELDAWGIDENRWPEMRDRDLFERWFALECHTMLYDVGNEPLLNEADPDDEDFEDGFDDDDALEDDDDLNNVR